MKKIMSSKFVALGLALFMVISILGTSLAPAGQIFAEASAGAGLEATAAERINVADATYAAAEYLLKGGVQSDWQAIGLAQAGYKLPASYLSELEKKVKDAAGDFTNVTDYARIVLAVRAIGADPTSFAGNGTTPGYNLIEKIYNNSKLGEQTLNNPVYALLALDSGKYNIPSDAKWTADKLLTEILSKQNPDGGFALTSGASEPDMTAITLTALAAHKNNPEAYLAGLQAVAWLSAAQDSHGGYGDSAESSAQAILGLTSFGVDPSGLEYTKNKVDLMENLLSYRLADGSFTHSRGGSSNILATEQGLQALVAYNLLYKGSNSKLYDFSKSSIQSSLIYAPVTIEGPQATLAQGYAYAGNALGALEKLALQTNLPITNPSGSYVTGIGSIAAGSFGGYDGWMYVVSRDGKWINPDVGMSDFVLKDSDQVLVYYAGDDTKLVDSVTLSKANLKEGDSFTVTVTSKTWKWDAATNTSSPVTAKAAGVQVQIGAHKVTTNAKGEAVFSGNMPAGDYTLTVTGYREGKAPTIAKYTKALKVISKNVTASLTVEGPEGLISEGTLKASNALEALQQLGSTDDFKVDITKSSYGNFVSGIHGVSQGTYDGWWSFVVSRGGEWIYPSVGMDAFELQESDRVLVYYAGENTQVVDSVVLSPSQPKANEAFTVKVSQKKWVWNQESFTSDPVTSPAAGVQVSIGDKKVITNEQGVAVVDGGLPASSYTLTVTGYAKDSVPSVARYTQSLTVGSSVIAPAKATATLSVIGDSRKGTILASTTVALKEGETAYSLLVSQLGTKVVSSGNAGSNYVKSIDGLAEFDGGPSSGWKYKTNRDADPSISADSYILQNGDTLYWYYTSGE
ncbi:MULTISPECIES: DUF4430 domain-containing protein [unclassified Paenibacillus]|uniref:DUF4430 domain-containing protein n=1 Tax=unclassified Paenibacillus TaxID=185978 RepID=UPI0024736BA5|nr:MULTISPECIES: DUF4430 domain-containing protein [unclassified Paenibacillus]MDH6430143.1 hypothetical protein [Paenibacillus sp. PastH-4]MDH6446357.1 hypothetical protein [Paenibacillus sp. PastF-4]MDH6530176.1 hypothetical protein [Paenibacillus sp. PastH-3]